MEKTKYLNLTQLELHESRKIDSIIFEKSFSNPSMEIYCIKREIPEDNTDEENLELLGKLGPQFSEDEEAKLKNAWEVPKITDVGRRVGGFSFTIDKNIGIYHGEKLEREKEKLKGTH